MSLGASSTDSRFTMTLSTAFRSNVALGLERWQIRWVADGKKKLSRFTPLYVCYFYSSPNHREVLLPLPLAKLVRAWRAAPATSSGLGRTLTSSLSRGRMLWLRGYDERDLAGEGSDCR